MEHQQSRIKSQNKSTRAIIVSALVIVILSNTPPAQFFLLENYYYQNADGSFHYSEEPGKGMDLKAGQIQFEQWKKDHPKNHHTTLYRTFLIQPWRFWEWWQYIAHGERFALPTLIDDKALNKKSTI